MTDLDQLAEAQHGMVSRAQVLAAGMTVDALLWAVRSGRWQRVHAGVYATFTGPLPFEAQVWAAILRAGRGAVASHRTAAYLDGLCDDPGAVIHVTAPADRYVEAVVHGVRVHFAHRLARTRHPSRNPPRTRVEDTVLDLVDAAKHPRDAETWVTAACQRRRTTPDRLADALGRRKKIRWRGMVEAMLADVADGAQSPLELRHLRRVERAHGLPTGCRQRRIAGQRVIWIDVDYDEYHVRVELDGGASATPAKDASATTTATTTPPSTAMPRCATGMPTSSATRAPWPPNKPASSRTAAGPAPCASADRGVPSAPVIIKDP